MKSNVIVAATIMRVVLGIIFLAHGIAKFTTGIEGNAAWFEYIGLPGFLASVVAVVEIAGGVALIVGLLTRYVSAVFAVLMIGATFTAKLSVGFLGNGEMAGYELDLALFAIALYFVITNHSGIGADSAIAKNRKGA